MSQSTSGVAKSANDSSDVQNAGSPSDNPMDRLVSLQDSMTGENAEPAELEDSPNAEAETEATEEAETPESDASETVESGESGSDEPFDDLSQSQEQTQWPEGLAQLPDDVRDEVIQVAKDVADGKFSFRDLKRGHKLIGKHAEEVERLTNEVETLRKQLNEQPAPQTPSESLQSLKTVADVERRQRQLETVMDWCEDNPEGGTYNGQEFSQDDVRVARAAARTELRQMPQRRQQLEQQADFGRKQQAAKAQARKLFPHLSDADNSETQAVSALLESQPWLKNTFESPEIAALTWLRGQAAIKAELAKRNGQAQRPATQRPATNRPSTGGAGGKGNTAGPSVASAKDRIGKERSVGALAELMAATGRG